MDGPPDLHPGLASHHHHSFRPSIHHHTNSASRVKSEPVANSTPEGKKRKSSHRHHHHTSRHEKDHRHGSSRRHAKEVVQSAIQLQAPSSFGDLLKQARGSKDTTPSHSRKGSVAHGVEGNNGDSKDGSDARIAIPPRRPLRPADVELERQRVEARERDLHIALKSLSDESLETSRRLDDTYYSILEKVSVLRQTIGTLQELSGLTTELHENFEADTKELTEDVQGQIDGFKNFDKQQKQIVDMEQRVTEGKTKADSLTDRLSKAKERVDARARSEAEWETKHTRRVRIFWGVLGFIATLILALVLYHQLKPPDITHNPKPALDFAARSQIMDAPIPDIAKEAIIGPSSSTATETLTPTSAVPVPGDDERLRVFDEL